MVLQTLPLAPFTSTAPELPQLTPDYLRRVSKTFPLTTAATYDGFHVRHYALLSDQALQVVATLLVAAEGLGQMPEQLRRVITHLTPKGGRRGFEG